jgi:hypothetical protein
MLFDAGFAARVLEDPAAHLPPGLLTPEEIEWLRRPDARAWKADPERPDRALSVLVQEYPASLALAAASGLTIDGARRFFSSEGFHQAIQGRGSMALTFGDYLLELARGGAVRDRRVEPMVKLERAIVRLRRTAGPHAPAGYPGADRYRLSGDKALHRAEAGTGDLHDAIHHDLPGQELDRIQAVFTPSGALPDLATDPDRHEPLLLELVRDDGPRVKFLVGIAEITGVLFDLLAYAETPRSRPELVARTVELGAEPEEAPEIVEGLIEEATLVPVVSGS